MSDASEVKRWSVNVGDEREGVYEIEDESGDWIRASDHDRIVTELKQQLSALMQRNDPNAGFGDLLNNKLQETIARQARVIEKLREQRDNLIPAALAEYATPMQVSDYRESLEYDIKDIEQEEKGT